MSDNSASDGQERTSIIGAVKTPLGFFALAVLVGEAGLLAFAAKAEGMDRTIGILGMIVLLFASGAAVYLLASRTPGALNTQSILSASESPSFDRVMAELSPTIKRLEDNDYTLAKYYRDQGDLQRLLDGLYSGLLYASGAVPTGRIEPRFYGNLMEWDGKSLRVRYFKGPYNDEIILRTFSLHGPKQGVASEAVRSKTIQYRNRMEDELKERGESLLKAMVAIPIPMDNGTTLQPGAIVSINIDSVQAGIFPELRTTEWTALEGRAQSLASLVRRVNCLRNSLEDKR